MAIRTSINETAVYLDERTWRASIETPLTGGYGIEVHRELVKRNAQNEVVGEAQRLPSIYRAASAIQAETVTVDVNGTPVVVSAALVMAALPLFFDRWAQEDEEE